MTTFFRTYDICLNILWTEYQVDDKHNEKVTKVKGIKCNFTVYNLFPENCVLKHQLIMPQEIKLTLIHNGEYVLKGLTSNYSFQKVKIHNSIT